MDRWDWTSNMVRWVFRYGDAGVYLQSYHSNPQVGDRIKMMNNGDGFDLHVKWHDILFI